MAARKKSGKYDLQLDSVVSISNAELLYAELKKLVRKKKTVVIDTSKVEMIDTAIFQLLLACTNKCIENKLKVTWKNPSIEFLKRAETVNLSEALGIDRVNNGK